MTGRRLYDRYCDVAKAQYKYTFDKTLYPHTDDPAIAWPFLSDRDRRIWNELARRITPKRRKAA